MLPGFFGPPFQANLELHKNENAAHSVHAADADTAEVEAALQTNGAYLAEQLVYSTASRRLRTLFPTWST